MRILLTTYPEKTVFQYLVPIAWALRTAGHEVRVASQANFSEVITQSGLTAQPAGNNPQPWRITNLTPAQRNAERAGLPEPYDVAEKPEKATWEYLTKGYARSVVGRYVMESIPMLPDLVEFARYWQPDLVIWESNCYAGPIAAKACGAAHARILFGIDIFGVTRDHYRRLKTLEPAGDRRPDAVADWFTAQIGEFSEDMVTGDFTIDQFPASLQTEADLHYLRMRFVPYGGPAVIPKWLSATPERPRVALTMGLSAVEHFDGYTIDLQDILDALAELDIEVVATISEDEQRRLTIPANTRAVPYVPLHALAPTCAAVIHHAGAATLATTSLHGVPQLAVHHHFDQPILATKLAAQGAGLALPAGNATGAAVRTAVREILTESAYRQAAIRLRDEIHALPSPNELVAQVVDLTAKYRTR